MSWRLTRWIYSSSLGDMYHDGSQVTDEEIDRYWELAYFDGKLQAFTDRVKDDLDSHSTGIAQRVGLCSMGFPWDDEKK